MHQSLRQIAWQEARSLAPIVAASRSEAETLRRLPDTVARAFVERDVYRLLLPSDLGGRGLDPLLVFDLIEEVSSYDGSVGWNYAIGSNGGMLAGRLSRAMAEQVFSTADCGSAGSGPPQGRAVAVEGGYRVTGRFAWASGVHQAKWVLGGCFVFDGDQRRSGPGGEPVLIYILVPRADIDLLDSWHTGGMRGTGSTEFELKDIFVPEERVFSLFAGEPTHPSPLYRLPTSYFGFALTAVPLGIARATVAGLKNTAQNRRAAPPRPAMSEQPFIQYTVAKAEAMVEASLLAVRAAFVAVWEEVQGGTASLESRARLRRASVHAVEGSCDAVTMCYRAAGGAALFEANDFERALRDVNAAAGHIVFQRGMMEDAGRVAMGLPPLLPMF